MGAAIAQRLIEVGHQVTVWNRTREKLEAVTNAGAAVAATPAELADRCATVITILTDAAAIAAVYDGSAGLLAGNVGEKLFIEMSTVEPQTEIELAAMVRNKGAAFVECPVGGTVGPARDGKLFGFAGGTGADVARARPLLEKLCRRIEHVGGAGAGARMKLAINLPLLVYWQSLGEALALCRPLGLPPERVVDILADTSGAATAMKNRAPDIARALGGQLPASASFDVRAARKDLSTMVAYAKTLGLDLPAASAALGSFDDAARHGLADKDAIAVPARWGTGT